MTFAKNDPSSERPASHLPVEQCLPRRLRALCTPFATATAVATVMALPRPGLAGPNGGTVVSGSATISQSGSTTNINQSTNNAVINWQGFSISSSETVNFNQPGSTSATLNRVIGNEQSIISGALNANGQVFIVNSAGVLFTRGAQVNVGGLVASTLDISNQNFMAGNYSFSGSSSASIVNQGRIHANDGGYIALLGKTVSNDGVIVAKLGTVAMASGEKITLNFAGNSLVDVTIDQGTLNALVANKRAIIADGGRVILTAKAADQVLSAQVNNSGIIQARTMASLKGGVRTVNKGSIKLLAQGGTVNVSGKLDASAPKGGDGGTIETSGDKVKMADSAVITTKAADGQNGSWLIDPDGFTIAATGGDISGVTLSNALASGSVTIASTSGSGTDGNINVNDAVTWSSNNTTLTLNATNSINVNQAITANGVGDGLMLNAANGGITINASIGPSPAAAAATLAMTLNAPSANGFVDFNAPVTVTSLNMTVPSSITFSLPSASASSPPVITNISKSYNIQGNYTFGSGGSVNFTTAGTPALTINNQVYTLITSMNDLSAINNNPAGHYALATNLDACGVTSSCATQITYTAAPITTFSGTLAGLGHTISNLTIVDLPAAAPPATGNGFDGLIGTATSSSVMRDIHLTNVNINNPDNPSGAVPSLAVLQQAGSDVGGLVGSNAGIIIGDSVTTGAVGYIVGLSNVGGLVGTSTGGAIINSVANVNVFAPFGSTGSVGGLVGSTGSATGVIINSASQGAVTDMGGPPAKSIGGLVGSNKGNIYGSTSSVIVSAINSGDVGGLVGTNTGTRGAGAGIYNSPATEAVSLNNSTATTGGVTFGLGGLVGTNSGGTLVGDKASGAVTATTSGSGGITNVGGLVGTNATSRGGGIIDSSSASGNVTVNGFFVSAAGGFVGNNQGFITNSSATGAVTGTSTPPPGSPPGFFRVGGFAGQNTGTVTGSSASGRVSGPGGPFTGGFIGENDGGTVAGNTFDSVRSGQPNGVGFGSGSGITGVIDPVFPAAAAAGNVAQGTAGTFAANPPSGAASTAGTAAATSPSSAALDANFKAIETGAQADDQRARRRIAAAPGASRRPGLGATIRSIEINGQRINVPENNAPGGTPEQNPR
jgi:filamentous hemagglutinin family protein